MTAQTRARVRQRPGQGSGRKWQTTHVRWNKELVLKEALENE
jgi:hypothetical protein